MKKRLLLLALLLLAGFAFIECDLHWVIPGWWNGEAFYQGRPTSYWRGELEQWSKTRVHWIRYNSIYERKTSPIEAYFYQVFPEQKRGQLAFSPPPPIHGDAEALSVLIELESSLNRENKNDDSQRQLLSMVRDGIWRIP